MNEFSDCRVEAESRGRYDHAGRITRETEFDNTIALPCLKRSTVLAAVLVRGGDFLEAFSQSPRSGQSLFIVPELGWLLPYLLIWAAITIPSIVAGWLLVFPKAGQARWAAIIPGYNIYVLVVGVAGLSKLWFVLVLIPGIQIIAAILVNVEVAKRFGRSEAFGLGLALLGFIFYPLLGLSPARYELAREPLW